MQPLEPSSSPCSSVIRQQHRPWPEVLVITALAVLLVLGISIQAQAASQHGRFIGAAPTKYPTWFKESFLEFRDDIEEAAINGKRVIILFHQDGCPYCNALVEKNLSQRDIEELLLQNFDVIAINMWGDREVVSVAEQSFSEKQFAAALKVQYTPTLIFFNERAQITLRLNGYLPPAEFKLALEYVAGKHEQQVSYRDYIANRQLPRRSSQVVTASAFVSTQSRDADKPTVVLFEQRDCPNCETLHERVFALPETRSLLNGFNRQRVDMWSNQIVQTPSGEKVTGRDWAATLSVNYAPSLIVFDPKGREVIRTSAYFKRFHTLGVLRYAASGAFRQEPSFQRYLNSHAEALRAQGQDVNIWD